MENLSMATGRRRRGVGAYALLLVAVVGGMTSASAAAAAATADAIVPGEVPSFASDDRPLAIKGGGLRETGRRKLKENNGKKKGKTRKPTKKPSNLGGLGGESVPTTSTPSSKPTTSKPTLKPTKKPTTEMPAEVNPRIQPITKSPTAKPITSASVPPTHEPTQVTEAPNTEMPSKPSTLSPTTSTWYPEIFTIRSSTPYKQLDCISGNEYTTTYLFDSEDECCMHFPCGKKLSPYWYQKADVDTVYTATVMCNFDDNYPMYMLVNTTGEKMLFASETECLAALGHTDSPSMKPTTAMPSQSPIAKPSTKNPTPIPTQHPSLKPTTATPSQSPTVKPSTGMPSKLPTLSPTTSTWYPEIFTIPSSTPYKQLDCVSGNEYPGFMTPPENTTTYLFDSEDECCMHFPCGKKLSPYWYQEADVDTATVVCKYDNNYPIYMLVNTAGGLSFFASKTECDAALGYTDSPSMKPTTAMPSQSPIAKPSTKNPTPIPTQHPSLKPTTATPSQSPTVKPSTRNPTSMPTHHPTAMPLAPFSPPTNSYPTRIPTQITLGAPPPPPPAENTAAPQSSPSEQNPTKMPTRKPVTSAWFFYPLNSGNKTHCAYGSRTRITALVNMTQDEQTAYLSSSWCECCFKHGCSSDTCSQCGQIYPTLCTTTTAATTPSTTTTTTAATTLVKAAMMPDVAPQWYFHPRKSDGWCAYGDIANDSSLASVNPEHLYLTLCECCTNHICPQYVVQECASAR
ncbi:hypothetical protein ACHAW5_011001 [Stephanodiscus triporus]|uniref:Uncharacterized protein n=1 Tax=Stephanodiscus triporus TaxID=2934178 RepID=A0ABD3MKI5_9STRA